jgi:hypothetical protein
MFLRTLFICTIFGSACGGSASAAPSSDRFDAEYFWQAYKGETILFPDFMFNYVTSNRSNPINGQQYFATGPSYGGSLQIERGLTNNISIGARGGYSSGTAEFNVFSPGLMSIGAWSTGQVSYTSSEGFENIDAFTKLRYDILRGTAYAGANFSFSPDRRREYFSGNSNRFTGGNAGQAWLGFHYPFEGFLIGVELRGDVYRQDRITDLEATGAQVTESKGLSRQATIFGEFLIEGIQFGLAFSYAYRDKAEKRVNSPIFWGLPSGISGSQNAEQIDPQDGIVLKAYSAINLAEGLDLWPHLTYSQVLSSRINGLNIDHESIVAAGLGFRFAF